MHLRSEAELFAETVIVADQQVCPLVGLEDLHEPLYGGDVQIIGGLIKQEELRAGLGQKHSGKFRAEAFAAG